MALIFRCDRPQRQHPKFPQRKSAPAMKKFDLPAGQCEEQNGERYFDSYSQKDADASVRRGELKNTQASQCRTTDGKTTNERKPGYGWFGIAR